MAVITWLGSSAGVGVRMKVGMGAGVEVGVLCSDDGASLVNGRALVSVVMFDADAVLTYIVFCTLGNVLVSVVIFYAVTANIALSLHAT